MKLQWKVFLMTSSIALLLGGPLLWTVRETVNRILVQDVSQKGLLATAQIVDRAEGQFRLGSEKALLPLLQAGQEESEALYVLASDASGRILAHTNVAETGKIYSDTATKADLHAQKPQSHPALYKGAAIMEVTIPVWFQNGPVQNEDFLLGGNKEPAGREYLGFIRMGLPLQHVLETEYRLIRRIIGIIFVVGGFGILLFFFFMRRLLSPIQWLSMATSRVAQGEYGATVPVRTKDELGDLARDFNRMSQVLSETTVSKKALEDSEERVRLVLDSAAEGIYGIDARGDCTFANQSCIELLGCKNVNDLLGKNMHDLMHHTRSDGRPYPVAECKIFQAFREGKGAHVENEVLWRLDGTSFPADYWSRPIFQEGKTIGAVVSFMDTTARKKLEAAVRQSEKMSAVGQLAAGVAHEINNPLGVILGFAQALVRRLQTNDPLEMPLKSIEKEAIRCKNLVQDLLTFSRTSKTEREPIELNRAVEGALSLVSAQARVARIDVKKELASGLPRILGNLNQIQQVIINLSNNALDAMTSAGVLTLKTDYLREGGLSWVRLTVMDTGLGIPPEIRSRIFDPFFTTKPVGKGTGLGLSLVHEIIQRHSGTIEVESQPGRTEFLVKFPVRSVKVPLASPRGIP
jgi:PAS domain S-box-containing protein